MVVHAFNFCKEIKVGELEVQGKKKVKMGYLNWETFPVKNMKATAISMQRHVFIVCTI